MRENIGKSNARVLYAGFRWKHHAKNGGYDWISYYPNATYFDAGTVPVFGKRLMVKSGGRIALFCTRIKTYLASRKYDVVHFFYGDQLFGVRKFICKKARLFATIHLRSSELTDESLKYFREYDAVVCLSSSETQALTERGIHAVFIPHGFNRPKFELKPLEKFGFDDTVVNVCFLGFNYRDFDMFEAVVKEFEHRNKKIVFHAVGQRNEEKKRFEKYTNVIIYPYITDDEYYSLIYACDYNFLPLIFATANNVLLEAQSLGTVSILPRISGISDYADEQENLFYTDTDSCISLFDHAEKRKKSDALVLFSSQFEWSKIYDQLKKLYEGAME